MDQNQRVASIQQVRAETGLRLQETVTLLDAFQWRVGDAIRAYRRGATVLPDNWKSKVPVTGYWVTGTDNPQIDGLHKHVSDEEREALKAYPLVEIHELVRRSEVDSTIRSLVAEIARLKAR